MSPRSTLMSWGSSSTEYLRITRPIRVTRGSFFILKTGPACSLRAASCALRASASTTMERNLSMLKRFPRRPTRSWWKKSGPREVSLIPIATRMRSGVRSHSAAAEATTSNIRLSAKAPGRGAWE